MPIKLITPAATDAITLEEAKSHLRVVDSDDDTYIGALIKAGITNAETWLGRALIDQTWELYLDNFPSTGEILIPLPPLIEVISIKYDDSAGVEQIISPSSYYVDTISQPGWVVPAGTLTWPTTIDAINSVRIRFRAGYLDNNSPPVAAVPFDIKAGILLNIGAMYEHREETVVGNIVNKLPWGSEQLFRPHRVLFGMA